MKEHDWEQYSGPAVCKRCGVISSDRLLKGPCLTYAERVEANIALKKTSPRKFSITPIFAWYDLWIGAFWDAKKRRLYILPLPCIGVVIQFGDRAMNIKSNLPIRQSPTGGA